MARMRRIAGPVALIFGIGIVSGIGSLSPWPFLLTVMGPFSYLAFTTGVSGWFAASNPVWPMAAWSILWAALIGALICAPLLKSIRAAVWLSYCGAVLWVFFGASIWSVGV